MNSGSALASFLWSAVKLVVRRKRLTHSSGSAARRLAELADRACVEHNAHGACIHTKHRTLTRVM